MPNPTVSWVVLTYNRAEKVARAMAHNFATMGEPYDELVWCDNGSTDGVRDLMKSFFPDVSILHERNLGVSHGYNRAMALSSSDYIVITGCDMLMPEGWLKTFKDYVRTIPETGVACMYHANLEWVPERKRKNLPEGKFTDGKPWMHAIINGLPIIHAMPIERRIISKKLLHKIGFFREDFGLYGWDDVEWAHRAERVCDELGLLYYIIPNAQPIHIGTEGHGKYDGKDAQDYWNFKQKEAADPWKQTVMGWCSQNNWPYYNPYSGATDGPTRG